MNSKRARRKPVVFTIGHSTLKLEDFLGRLEACGIKTLADVRTIPRSRFKPQYNKERLNAALEKNGIAYVHLPELGGLRHPRRDSVNTAWRNDSFRGYADYMQTPEFGKALDTLIALAKKRKTAIMCAEALPWLCHRSLIADALLVRGFSVRHIVGQARDSEHVLTAWAVVRRGSITYPASVKPRKKLVRAT